MHTSVNVLLVEDNDLAKKIARSVLSSLGCQVETAANGQKALELAEQKQFNIIFMDLGLPDTNGVDVTRKILNSSYTKPPLPIVALTAHDNDENKQQCADVGMSGFIVKPITSEKILEIFERLNIKEKKIA